VFSKLSTFLMNTLLYSNIKNYTSATPRVTDHYIYSLLPNVE